MSIMLLQMANFHSFLWLSSILFGDGNGTPLQYSCLENPMERGAWWAAVHEVAKSWTRLSNFPFTFHFHALGKEMATHSSILAWRIPGTGVGACWWAAVYGVTQSRTRLKRLSSSSSSSILLCVCMYIYAHISHPPYPFICWWTLRLHLYLGYYK